VVLPPGVVLSEAEEVFSVAEEVVSPVVVSARLSSSGVGASSCPPQPTSSTAATAHTTITHEFIPYPSRRFESF
jgi:hypothetical protein